MSHTLELFVFAVPGDAPEGLRSIAPNDRPRRSVFTRTHPLVAQPPPDTLFMRATGLDLSVFGEPTAEGELQMIDGKSLAKHAFPELERHVNRFPDSTVRALAALAAQHGQRCDERALREALEAGAWPTTPDALVQAAAFAKVLHQAACAALPNGHAVVWLYRGGPLRYRYP